MWPLGGPGAAWSAFAAGVGGRPVLVTDHDTDPAGVRRVLEALAQADVVVTAVPVTDTVKVVRTGAVVATYDRDQLITVRPPLGLRAAAASSLPAPGRADLGEWLAEARAAFVVEVVDPPR